ncbi:TlpA family protein disulfide reductase [Sphingobacteriales bacterium UPWRP_1]|nr:hypothetical protein BVG80_05860 [Sphingobacteriales bacterium TSM_CSM]PSJ74465.1 TlpA family protein disulfide reductase [Sphingobacteriales bacterium UPWRP_1]
MRRIFQICLTLVFIVSAFATAAAQAVDKLPSIELMNMNGEKVNIANYGDNGKITVFSFWATWCAPCKKELVNLAELYDEWKEAYNLEIVAVSTDDQRTAPKVKPYVDGQGWEFDVLLDVNEDLKRALNFQTVPYTLVKDQKGNIVFEHSGYVEGDEYELQEVIEKLYAAEEEGK